MTFLHLWNNRQQIKNIIMIKIEMGSFAVIKLLVEEPLPAPHAGRYSPLKKRGEYFIHLYLV